MSRSEDYVQVETMTSVVVIGEGSVYYRNKRYVLGEMFEAEAGDALDLVDSGVCRHITMQEWEGRQHELSRKEVGNVGE